MVGPRSGALEEEGGASSPLTTTTTTTKKKNKWAKMMPLLVVIVVVAEIAFLGRLDLAKNAAVVNSWTGYFHQHSSSSLPEPGLSADELGLRLGLGVGRPYPSSSSSARADDGCEEWLERVDAVEYSRDFAADPILVSGGEEQEWKTCDVGCKFGYKPSKKPDAAFGHPQDAQTAGVIRSMESAHYYSENNIDQARRNGYKIVMTTSLSSDVPVGYFSWAEYDIMAPLQPKTEKAHAAAFISNCGARNFRLEALEALERAQINIDSYGGCHRNRGGNVDKVTTLKRYKFSLAFENSNEEDYVTEKFFQSLVAGSIPVVIGAPNILEFAPSRKSILHIKELKDVDEVAKTMKYLSENSLAYSESLRWKYEGPSDSFKALVDMAAVHSSCRLCIHLATGIREQEERSLASRKRPCKCTRGSETVHHLYVRERGRFHMVSIFLRDGNLTLEALESAVLKKFRSLKHVPIWKQERPESIRGVDKLKVYKVYPLGLTQRKALYNFKFQDDFDFRNHLESNPCAKFEVIFV